jgi:hypothetical protein
MNMSKVEHSLSNTHEVVDANELAKRWRLPVTWIREQTRSRADDPYPASALGDTFASSGARRS